MAEPAERDLRYEIKTVTQEDAYADVRMRLRLDPAGIRPLHADRRVQSVYFDTLDQAALEDNLAGISHREKIRYRWYGDVVRQVDGHLERKVRHNQLGWKDVVDIPEPVDVEGVGRGELKRAIFSQLPDGFAAIKDEGLEPVQWISYLREYHATADGSVRVTIDRELRAYDLRARLQVTSAYPTPTPRVLIIEAKCAKAAYPEAQRLMNRFLLTMDRCSKFVLASRPEHGPPVSLLR